MSSAPVEYDPYHHVARFETDAGQHIYRIRCDLLRPLPGYAYLLLGDHPATLIDCGTGENGCDRELLGGLDLVRATYKEHFKPTDIRRIIITHGHIDHAGGTRQLLDLTGAEAWCHRYDSSIFTRYDERAAVSNRRFDDFLRHAGVELERRRGIIDAFGFVRGRGKPFPVSRHLKDGEQFDGITVYHTPGHSPGHLCLQIDGSHIILGDHILARTTTQLWPQQVTPHTGYWHYRHSVRKIAAIAEGKIGLPGHEQVIENLPQRIELVGQSHQRRLERILDILQNHPGPMSIAQIARKMYVSQDPTRSLLALTDIGARIEYLEQIGAVTVENFDDLELNRTDVYLYQNAMPQ
jgi:glyoxylase-like metal-dependent hydrolase (beta-lactamase superfamily II)